MATYSQFVANTNNGFVRVFALPATADFRKFMGIWMTVATANVTTARINSFLTLDPSKWMPFVDAVN